jgi:hypothetical protein
VERYLSHTEFGLEGRFSLQILIKKPEYAFVLVEPA